MKEQPIISTTELIPKILDGTKTQTRRVIKPQPANIYHNPIELAPSSWAFQKPNQGIEPFIIKCPYGQVGDRLWVRETWNYLPDIATSNPDAPNPKLWYRADFNTKYNFAYPWKSAIFMPRWASRITLEITNLRVERLQEITEADAEAEGSPDHGLNAGLFWYRNLWDFLNAKRGYSWESNPWVWVIEFRQVKQ